ncbi:hypothetical protein [Actinoallomurus sp. NPDC050550]|uniref:hypothetical protein n=1 Tax=Actinoallomurus sp. NPDC050550 TaxID=3154937 RepID=UPI0033D33CC8
MRGPPSGWNAFALLGRTSGLRRECRRVPVPVALGVHTAAVVAAVLAMAILPRGWRAMAAVPSVPPRSPLPGRAFRPGAADLSD